MRMLAVVLALVPVLVAAQTTPELKTVTSETLRVSPSVLRGMAEAEPDIAAPAGATEQGSVLLQVVVSKTGAVQEAVAISGPEDLKRAAIDGVMGWSYKPYLLNGQPQDIQSSILLNFHDKVGKRAETGIAGMTGLGGPAGAAPMPPLANPPGTVRVSAGVAAGMLMQPAAQPVYPPIAKAAHVQGTVVLHALISKTGDVQDLQVVSGPPMLTAAAMDAVRRWKYQPYLLSGMPVTIETTINVNFTFGSSIKQPDAAGDAGSAETK